MNPAPDARPPLADSVGPPSPAARRDMAILALWHVAELAETVESLAASLREAAWRRDADLVMRHARDLREEVVATLRAVKAFDEGGAS